MFVDALLVYLLFTYPWNPFFMKFIHATFLLQKQDTQKQGLHVFNRPPWTLQDTHLKSALLWLAVYGSSNSSSNLIGVIYNGNILNCPQGAGQEVNLKKKNK